MPLDCTLIILFFLQKIFLFYRNSCTSIYCIDIMKRKRQLSLKSTNESREGHSTRFFYGNSQTQKSDGNLTFSQSPTTSMTEQAEPRKAEKKTFRPSGIFRLKSPTRSREEMSTSSIGKTENVKSGIPEKQSFTSRERLSLKC
ncbi:uncharacterized protein LOC122508265 [Leptopilina heterotoma]|uniref:uncharacterized protein LOC122508265 n=1 Tax=Leptopilina heterotoma TaxID=63436 RepID=UPI001CA92DB4|nr:uncharacterized protein LOC122508265 [Leptopilina heterotoma]